MEKEDLKNVGALCPLCQKGIIRYMHRIISGWMGKDEIEYVSCSNWKCNAYTKISDSTNNY